MKTYDNFRYDCQAIGEVVLSKSMTGSKFEVQGLFAPSVFFPSRVTVTSGLAMTYHGGPTIEFTTAKEPAYGLTMISGCPVAVFVDGKLTNISRNRVFPDGSQIIRDSGRISAHFPNGLSVYADTSQTGFNRCWFRVAVVKLSGKIIRDDGNIVGLLGSPNGNSSDEWMNRSGTPFNHPFPRLGPVALQYCQGTWGVKKADSLFADHHSRPTVTPPKPYIKIPDLKDVPPEVLAICGPLNIDCQLDGLVGGVEFAREALDNMDLIEEIEKMPEVTPPPFPGPNQSHEPMERILTSDDRPYVKRSVQYNSIQDI